MFWKNNYSFSETTPDYFENKNRTNFTYAESSSYRLKSNKSNCNAPYLFRKSINGDFIDITEEMSMKSIIEIPIRKSLNNAQDQATPRTPINRKSVSSDSDRVLRSRTNRVYLNNSKIPFVRESGSSLDTESVRSDYQIGALNTNTNNSGPDELEDNIFTKTALHKYDLSGDEEIGSDIDDRTTIFGSNNANSSKAAVSSSDKVPGAKTRWYPKNMFGLPNDESDEVNQDLSGAISGDEQYDIAPYQKTGLNLRSKGSKTGTRRSSKFDSNTNRTFDNILCSPLAMLSFIVEWIWKVVRVVSLQVAHFTRRITFHSTLFRWLTLPFCLSRALIQNVVAIFAYVSDKLFGTSFLHRMNNQHRIKRTSSNWLSRIIWFLLLIFAILLLLRYLSFNEAKIVNTDSTVSSDFHLSQYAYQFVGNDCMIANDCCHSYWSLIRRFTFCFFSLPMRMVLPSVGKLETNINLQDTPKLSTSNDPKLEEFVGHLKSRLEYYDKQFSNYDVKIQRIEEDSKTSYQSRQESDKKVSDLTKDIESASVKLSMLQMDVEHLKTLRAIIENSLESLSRNQKDNMKSMSENQENLKTKLEEDLKLMSSLINKVNLSSLANVDSNNKLEKLLVQLQTDMDNTQRKLNEMDKKTIHLEQSNQKLIHDNTLMKESIMDEVKEKITQFQIQQHNIEEKLNNQMSKFEYFIEENQSKLSDKDYLNNLLENLSLNIKKDINSSIWADLSDRVRNVLKSSDMNQEKFKAASIFSSADVRTSCNCLPSSCRCPNTPTTCVRVNEVRKLLKEALALFAADKIGMADFALESAGGTIATTRCTETYTDRASTLTIFGIPLLRLTNSPRTIIQPSMNPGECWPMKGDTGSVVVQLSAQVKVEAVSIDHIPKSLSPSESIDSALREFEIKALSNESDKLGKSLGNFTYLIDSNPVQTFRLENPIETKFVELIVKSNYGNKEYTCIYRFRVHGKLITT